jgi:protein FRA10AC1
MNNTINTFKTDYEILKENYKFVWDEKYDHDKDKDNDGKWEEKFAKTYYDKLYKEYAIADLSLYKEGK